jgi:lipoprotein-anchoring transpeptidase ErfK/SrfK
MKRLLLMVALVLTISAGDAAGWASSPTDPSAYAVNIHVSKSYLEFIPAKPINNVVQRLDVRIDGHHLILDGAQVASKKNKPWLLPIGDYKARVKKEDTAPNGAYWRTYEILLKDGSTWDGDVVAENE